MRNKLALALRHFLATSDFADTTRRVYGRTLGVLVDDFFPIGREDVDDILVIRFPRSDC